MGLLYQIERLEGYFFPLRGWNYCRPKPKQNTTEHSVLSTSAGWSSKYHLTNKHYVYIICVYNPNVIIYEKSYGYLFIRIAVLFVVGQSQGHLGRQHVLPWGLQLKASRGGPDAYWPRSSSDQECRMVCYLPYGPQGWYQLELSSCGPVAYGMV